MITAFIVALLLIIAVGFLWYIHEKNTTAVKAVVADVQSAVAHVKSDVAAVKTTVEASSGKTDNQTPESTT